MGAVSVPPDLESTVRTLEAYCRAHDWAGNDPYDALNSELFARTPLMKSRIARLALTQFLKRSPVNFRPLLRIPPQRDPKGTALFLAAYVRMARQSGDRSRATAALLAARLLELRSPETDYWCWGYSFPWQTRRRLVPRSSPNLVTTVFAANALLDAYELDLGEQYLLAASSAGEYLERELLWEDGAVVSFAYPMPDIRVPIHNANLLGAALLCRLAKLTGDTTAVNAALRVARFSTACQREDGSWPYGVAPTQQWADNFHTGYNLEALQSIGDSLGTDEFDAALQKGLRFYRDHFFTREGVAKYFHDKLYPIDIHCVAQGLITLTKFRHLDPQLDGLARQLLSWALLHMWDERGFFSYRILRTARVRISYMRWSQAWMLFALTYVLTPRHQASGQ